MIFSYTAINSYNQEKTGDIQAHDEDDCRNRLYMFHKLVALEVNVISTEHDIEPIDIHPNDNYLARLVRKIHDSEDTSTKGLIIYQRRLCKCSLKYKKFCQENEKEFPEIEENDFEKELINLLKTTATEEDIREAIEALEDDVSIEEYELWDILSEMVSRWEKLLKTLFLETLNKQIKKPEGTFNLEHRFEAICYNNQEFWIFAFTEIDNLLKHSNRVEEKLYLIKSMFKLLPMHIEENINIFKKWLKPFLNSKLWKVQMTSQVIMNLINERPGMEGIKRWHKIKARICKFNPDSIF